MALRRVFEQDSDFKERMFARQIAVMKGQAWNVVETLKTPDHGPLELTRRARVCVWDDIVEIPVAIPLENTSAEIRRQDSNLMSTREEEEMDISSANGPVRGAEDLMKFSSAPGELPNPNRFELSRNPSQSDLGHMFDEPTSPATIHGTERRDFGTIRPNPTRSKTRSSFEGHRRRGSLGGRRRFSFTRSFMYDNDDEGDIGYAAAEDTEKNTRKVIVERLEPVKSKNPVFTWC